MDLLDALKANEGSPERAASSLDLDEGKPFDWTGLHPEALVVGQQRPIAVYRNTVGAVIIREEGEYAPDDDPFIVLRDDAAVKALICSLQLEVGGL